MPETSSTGFGDILLSWDETDSGQYITHFITYSIHKKVAKILGESAYVTFNLISSCHN